MLLLVNDVNDNIDYSKSQNVDSRKAGLLMNYSFLQRSPTVSKIQSSTIFLLLKPNEYYVLAYKIPVLHLKILFYSDNDVIKFNIS